MNPINKKESVDGFVVIERTEAADPVQTTVNEGGYFSWGSVPPTIYVDPSLKKSLEKDKLQVLSKEDPIQEMIFDELNHRLIEAGVDSRYYVEKIPGSENEKDNVFSSQMKIKARGEGGAESIVYCQAKKYEAEHQATLLHFSFSLNTEDNHGNFSSVLDQVDSLPADQFLKQTFNEKIEIVEEIDLESDDTQFLKDLKRTSLVLVNGEVVQKEDVKELLGRDYQVVSSAIHQGILKEPVVLMMKMMNGEVVELPRDFRYIPEDHKAEKSFIFTKDNDGWSLIYRTVMPVSERNNHTETIGAVAFQSEIRIKRGAKDLKSTKCVSTMSPYIPGNNIEVLIKQGNEALTKKSTPVEGKVRGNGSYFWTGIDTLFGKGTLVDPLYHVCSGTTMKAVPLKEVADIEKRTTASEIALNKKATDFILGEVALELDRQLKKAGLEGEYFLLGPTPEKIEEGLSVRLYTLKFVEKEILVAAKIEVELPKEGVVYPESTVQLKVKFVNRENINKFLGKRTINEKNRQMIQKLLDSSPEIKEAFLNFVKTCSDVKKRVLSTIDNPAYPQIRGLDKNDIQSINDIFNPLVKHPDYVYLIVASNLFLIPFVKNTQPIWDSHILGLFDLDPNQTPEKDGGELAGLWEEKHGKDLFAGATAGRSIDQARNNKSWNEAFQHHITVQWENTDYDGELLNKADRVIKIWPEDDKDGMVKMRIPLDLTSLELKSKKQCLLMLSFVETIANGENLDWLFSDQTREGLDEHQLSYLIKLVEGGISEEKILKIAAKFVYDVDHSFLKASLEF